jgi:hypothetical protein
MPLHQCFRSVARRRNVVSLLRDMAWENVEAIYQCIGGLGRKDNCQHTPYVLIK